MKITLDEAIKNIEASDEIFINKSRQKWNSIAKPLKSLGSFEKVIANIAGMIQSTYVNLDKKALVIMCADNGVVKEGVTQTGQEVTAIVSDNFLKKKTSVAIMADYAGVDVFPIDIGVATDTHIINKKISYGTKNMKIEPAMSRNDAIRAIETGIEFVGELKDKGYKIIATGEMGIGNTTTSSAVASVMMDIDVEKVTGKGAGLSDEGLKKKILVIKEAIQRNKPYKEDAIDVISKVGGLDIAGLTGVFLGGAVYKIPIVIDGFISAVAALCAVKIKKETADYIIPSHVSKEPASKMILEMLNMQPFITADMCLGEGTGAVALMPLLDMACRIYNDMSTFDDIKVEAYKEL